MHRPWGSVCRTFFRLQTDCSFGQSQVFDPAPGLYSPNNTVLLVETFRKEACSLEKLPDPSWMNIGLATACSQFSPENNPKTKALPHKSYAVDTRKLVYQYLPTPRPSTRQKKHPASHFPVQCLCSWLRVCCKPSPEITNLSLHPKPLGFRI